MNTECVFISKNNPTDEEKLHRLASIINESITPHCELYAYTISEIVKTTTSYNSYDEAAGWRSKGKRTTLNTGDKVLFVGGKLHYMNKDALRSLLSREDKKLLSEFKIVFPTFSDDFFKDICEVGE